MNIAVGVWRQYTPEDVQPNAAQMNLDNTSKKNRSWTDDDLEKSKKFWTIGVGVEDYYLQR